MTRSLKDIAIQPSASWRKDVEGALQDQQLLDTRSVFHELNPKLANSPIWKGVKRDYRDAAVLFPIMDRPEEPTVLFTVRSNDMPSHAGQICFPGGRVAVEDRDKRHTAMRETQEEVGIAPDQVEILGDMGVHLGGMGFAVTPVIGVINPQTEIIPCPREVQQVFEVPFSYLLDQDNHVLEERENNGVRYIMPAIPFEGFHIWGLTAGIIHTLSRAISSR